MNSPIKEHVRANYAISSLYLDPNNYRFRDKAAYVEVHESNVTDQSIQQRTLGFISGARNEDLKDLIDSFKQNGYLPVDQIQVRRVDEKKIIVIEGNRRVAALKVLARDYENHLSIGKLDPEIFRAVPVALYSSDDGAKHKILMGLKHISGNKKWPAINQAKLIHSLINDDRLSEEEVCRSIGIKRPELRSTLRTLSLVDVYLDSDYGDQFVPEKYSVFKEIIKSQKIVKWLGLSNIDFNIAQLNETNIERIFSWISTVDEDVLDDDLEEENYLTVTKEPVINTALQIRELAKLIDDDSALENLDSTRSLSEALLSSESLGKSKLENSLKMIKEQTNVAFNFSSMMSSDNLEIVKDSINRLQALLTTKNSKPEVNERDFLDKTSLYQDATVHFTEIYIRKYKKFTDTYIGSFKAVNIFAGLNNSGKSSILEALYIVTKLSDPKSHIKINNFRNKNYASHTKEITSSHYNSIIDSFDIEAIFEDEKILTKGQKKQQSDLSNIYDYIGTFFSETLIGEDRYNFSADFTRKGMSITSNTNNILCNSIFSSPSSIDEEALFRSAYSKAVRNGAKKEVVDFIKLNIDPDIIDIELLSNDNTFFVSHKDREKCLDLSLYGDGLQKVFFLAIKISACESGVILLDEIENGIHKNLLAEFTALIEILASRYRVQVFITSHSKECIDSFVTNRFKGKEISAYTIDGNGKIKHFSEEDLENLIPYINLDIREV